MPMPVTPVVLPHRAKARAFLWAGVALLAVAAAAQYFEATIAALVLASLAVTPVLLWAMLWWIARVYERRAEDLLAGRAVLRWDYAADEWQAFVAAEASRQASHRVPLWSIGGILAFVGVMGAAHSTEDGNLLADSLLVTWMVLPLGAAAFGVIAGIVMRAHASAWLAAIRRADGVFCLGADDLYLTGSYWRLRGFGMSSDGVTLEDGNLVFAFRVYRGGLQQLRVPVPSDRGAEAQDLVDRFARG